MAAPAEHDERSVVPTRVAQQFDRAAAAFRERFGRVPTLAVFAPGRVNLIGEHTDYNRGFVLPIAIEREAVIVADRAAGLESSVHLADIDVTLRADLTRPLASRRGQYGNHLLGVADQFQRRSLTPCNVDALLTSTVPIGAGLSSSAAIEVAFAMLLQAFAGAKLTPMDLARLCQAAEHEFGGVPCGIMDMCVSTAAKRDHALLIDCRSEYFTALPAEFARHAVTLLVIDTGVKHDLATSAYGERRRTCAEVAAALGLDSLREAALQDLNMHGLSTVQRRRALHVISENARTILAAEALALGGFPRVGELMFASHASLRDLYEVSCPELDVIVDTAAAMRERDEGVLGARMTGGGFGGCAIALCRAEAVELVRVRLVENFSRRFGRAPATFQTSAAGGARAIPWPCYARAAAADH
jgi:galactokinase